MIKYYAGIRFGSATVFSFRVEKETKLRYYIDKASIKRLRGSWGGYRSYIEKRSPHLYDSAKAALDGLIRAATQNARGAYKVYQHAKVLEEELTALRGREPFV